MEGELARNGRKLSPLGRKLLDARRRIERSGVPLLDEKQIAKEKAERRGGVPNR
jgi:hypothetical protein